MDSTISWLSQARLDCYLHGQAFLILQRKMHALLAGGMIHERLSRWPWNWKPGEKIDNL
jgi:hypothetical protein